ncbi:MAG: translation initiation factor IF-2 [Pseudomonadota bacterium]
MAEVTVRQLADKLNVTADMLLTQMRDAGLAHSTADAAVSDVEKEQLLSHLKRAHGKEEGESKRITLKRKETTTIKTASAATGKTRAVEVQVKKTRTYVKRSELDAKAAEEEAQRIAEEEARAAAEQAAREAEARAAEARRDAEAREAEARRGEAEARRKASTVNLDDVEAAHRHKVVKVPHHTTEAARHAAEKAAKIEAEERKKREEAEARKRQNAGALKEVEAKAAKETVERAKRLAEELAGRGGESRDESDSPVVVGPGIVARAFEQSIEDEAHSLKKDGKNKLVGKRRKQTQKMAFEGTLKSTFLKGHAFEKPTQKMVYEVEVGEAITVGDLAQKLSMKVGELIKTLMKMGEMVTVNHVLDQDTAVLLVEELGHKAKMVSANALEEELAESITRADEPQPRAPVVTIMGHVDHGKTSLLDYIRRAKVAAGEAGGITQHIGAYHVDTGHGMITFLDTPGHAAFTAMRARGASATDIVIIVVAADDGVMPQTIEAINHAKAAGVPLIVAVNKMDKPSADPDRVRNELSQHGVISEEWGGDTQFVPVSAHTGLGVEKLLDAILIQAEVLELKAVPAGAAEGVVIESRLDKGRGPIASLLIQQGELHPGDMVLAGQHYGRVRAMSDEQGRILKSAGPSIPVEILGLAGVPDAGDKFMVVPDERKAREVAQHRIEKDRTSRMARQQASKLENVFANMGAAEKPTVNIVLKTDVRGSLEALMGALNDLSTEEVKVNIVSSGVGAITESDVNLAITSRAVMLAFNVRADSTAKKLCEREGIDLRYYSVIYEMIDDVKAAMGGLLAPEKRETILGVAEVREVFRSSKFGDVAGCMVVEGSVFRNRPIRVLRNDVVVFQGALESLRRFKDDVSEVRAGMDCGIAVRGYNDVKAGDKIEVYEVKEVARSL